MLALTTVETSILDIAHLVGVATVEHLVDETVRVGRVVARTELFKPLPVIDEDLFEDIPVPRRFDNHQIAPSPGIGYWGLGMWHFYHISPLTSTPHRSSLCPPLPTHLSLSYGDFWDRKNANSGLDRRIGHFRPPQTRSQG